MLFCILFVPLRDVRAATANVSGCGLGFSLIGRPYVSGSAEALPVSIEDAKNMTLRAWATTSRYMRKNGISNNPENQPRILAIFDGALSHELTPLGLSRKFRRENGLRVVDAPQLEWLSDRNVPHYIAKHLTKDHHNSFGVGLGPNVNSATQILDMLDSKNSAYVGSSDFSRAFKNFSSDNVGDAFGLARAIVRNAEKIRANPRLRKELKQLAIAEDFGVFGPGLNLDGPDKLPALLKLNDDLLKSVGPDRTFMDRISLGFGDQTRDAIQRAGDDYDRVRFPKSVEDHEFAKKLADEFRHAVRDGIGRAEKARVVISSAQSGQPLPIYFADTTKLMKPEGGEFEGWVTVPQFVRKLEVGGATRIERNFSISGDSDALTRTMICANFPGRGTPMNAVLPGNSQTFAYALIQAEAKAIQARLPRLQVVGGDALVQAQDRLAKIESGTWSPQSRPDGTLIFGTTDMTADEFRQFIEKNTELLGYK